MVFDENKLRKEIAGIWGEHGAHIEVFDALVKSSKKDSNGAIFVGLHAQHDDKGRMVFLAETREGDSLTLLIARNYPYGDVPTTCPVWIISHMPVFRTNTEAESWLRTNTLLLENKKS